MSRSIPSLDELLPLITVSSPEIHTNAAVLEVAEPSQLMELAVQSKVRPYLLGRLNDTAALVRPQCALDLEKVLKGLKHTPKMVRQAGGKE